MGKVTKFIKKKQTEFAKNRKERMEFASELKAKRVISYKKQALKEASLQGTRLAQRKFRPESVVVRAKTPQQMKDQALWNQIGLGMSPTMAPKTPITAKKRTKKRRKKRKTGQKYIILR